MTARLTMREAAELWGVTPQIVHVWRNASRLQCFENVDGRWSAPACRVRAARVLKLSGVARLLGASREEAAERLASHGIVGARGRYSLDDVAKVQRHADGHGRERGEGADAALANDPDDGAPAVPLVEARRDTVTLISSADWVDVERASAQCIERRRARSEVLRLYRDNQLDPSFFPGWFWETDDCPMFIPREHEWSARCVKHVSTADGHPLTILECEPHWAPDPYWNPESRHDPKMVLLQAGHQCTAGGHQELGTQPEWSDADRYRRSRGEWEAEWARHRTPKRGR